MRVYRGVFVCVLGVVAACGGDPTAVVPPVDHDAQGSWGQDTHGVTTHSSFDMSLTESGGTITGVGSFSGEAGPYGSLQVSGTVSQDSVKLQIVFTSEPTVFPLVRPDTAQFAGLLTSQSEIAGKLTRAGTTQPFDLLRLTIGDPP